MRRFVLSLMYIVLIISSLSARTITSFQSKEIQLQAGYGDVIELVVTPLPAQANSYMQGMPFSIEEQYVQFDYTTGKGVTENGREIAEWSVIANSRFTMTVDAAPMHHVDRISNPDAVDLDYKLTFFYTLGYALADGKSVTLQNQSFTVQSNKEDNSNKLSLGTAEPDIENSYIGTANGTIFFQFLDTASRQIEAAHIDNANLKYVPYGDYEAVVKITITPIERGDV